MNTNAYNNTISSYPNATNNRSNVNAIDQLRVIPHSIEAEQALIGGLMLDNTAWDRIVDLVGEEDFYRPEHKTIFHVLANLSIKNQPFDVITVSNELKNLQQLENVGGEVYLFELAKNIPVISNINSYAGIVRERSVLRQLINICNETADLAFNPQDLSVADILHKTEGKIFKIAEQQKRGRGPVDMSSILLRATDKIDRLYHSEDHCTGIPTGFVDVDEFISGLQESDLIIVAGRPSMGKTTFAMNIVESVAIKEKKSVLVFSMEMPDDALAMRMISSLGRIEQQKVRTGQLEEGDWARIASTVNMLSDTSIFIDDTPALTPMELLARARRLVRSHGDLALIVIDYLQLMQISGSKENRTTEISEISRNLKAMAKELRVPVIVLSQLNRGLEQRTDKRPMMSDLRESGAIEQDADLILFIYRDEVYNSSSDESNKGVAEIIVAKHRNGPTGKVNLTFSGKYTKFENHVPNSPYIPQG